MPPSDAEPKHPEPRRSWLGAAIAGLRLANALAARRPEPPVSWLSLFRTARAPLAVLLLAAIGLLLPPQTADMLATLSDGGGTSWLLSVSFQFSLAFLSVSAWYWARAMIDARFDVRGTQSDRTRKVAADPRIDAFALDAVPWLIVGISALLGICLIPRGQILLNLVLLAIWVALFAAIARTSYNHPPASGDSRKAHPSNSSLVETLAELRARWVERKTLRVRLQLWWRRWQLWWHRRRARWQLLTRRAPGPAWLTTSLVIGALLVFLLGAIVSFMPSAWAADINLPSRIAAIFPGPAAALICLGLIIGPLSVLTFLADERKWVVPFKGRSLGFSRPPIILLLGAWIAGMPYLFSLHTVRVVPSQQVAARNDLATFFTTWAAACAPKDDSPLRPIIVAVSGGASRAAVWGASVLGKVEAASPTGRGPTVFAVSSVSGGSLGVAAYMATLRNLPADQLCAQGSTAARKAQVASLDKVPLGHDALGPLLAAAVAVDIPRSILSPFAAVVRGLSGNQPSGGDRAEAIELAFEAIWKESAPKADGIFFDHAFLSLFYDGSGKIRPGMPIWIANGTETGTGGRLLTVPFAPDRAVWPFHSARDLLFALNADVRVSTAINNTARFPYLEPSGELLAVPDSTSQRTFRRQLRILRGETQEVIDGGYFENEGLQTALELAEWLSTAGPVLVGNRPVHPIIVQATGDGDAKVVDKDVVRCGDRNFDDPRDRSPMKPPLQLLAPILGLYNVRGGHSAVALRAAKLGYCADSFFHFYLPGKSTGTGVDDDKSDVPLNWVLSDGMTSFVRGAIGDKGIGNEDEGKRLVEVLAR